MPYLAKLAVYNYLGHARLEKIARHIFQKLFLIRNRNIQQIAKRQADTNPKEVKLRNHSLAIGYFWANNRAKKFNQKA